MGGYIVNDEFGLHVGLQRDLADHGGRGAADDDAVAWLEVEDSGGEVRFGVDDDGAVGAHGDVIVGSRVVALSVIGLAVLDLGGRPILVDRALGDDRAAAVGTAEIGLEEHARHLAQALPDRARDVGVAVDEIVGVDPAFRPILRVDRHRGVEVVVGRAAEAVVVGAGSGCDDVVDLGLKQHRVGEGRGELGDADGGCHPGRGEHRAGGEPLQPPGNGETHSKAGGDGLGCHCGEGDT